MPLVRVSEETKEALDRAAASRGISINDVIATFMKTKSPGPSPQGLGPNDEYRVQCLEAAMRNRGIDLDAELTRVSKT